APGEPSSPARARSAPQPPQQIAVKTAAPKPPIREREFMMESPCQSVANRAWQSASRGNAFLLVGARPQTLQDATTIWRVLPDRKVQVSIGGGIACSGPAHAGERISRDEEERRRGFVPSGKLFIGVGTNQSAGRFASLMDSGFRSGMVTRARPDLF